MEWGVGGGGGVSNPPLLRGDHKYLLYGQRYSSIFFTFILFMTIVCSMIIEINNINCIDNKLFSEFNNGFVVSIFLQYNDYKYQRHNIGRLLKDSSIADLTTVNKFMSSLQIIIPNRNSIPYIKLNYFFDSDNSNEALLVYHFETLTIFKKYTRQYNHIMNIESFYHLCQFTNYDRDIFFDRVEQADISENESLDLLRSCEYIFNKFSNNNIVVCRNL